jgi:hypothetical protein
MISASSSSGLIAACLIKAAFARGTDQRQCAMMVFRRLCPGALLEHCNRIKPEKREERRCCEVLCPHRLYFFTNSLCCAKAASMFARICWSRLRRSQDYESFTSR